MKRFHYLICTGVIASLVAGMVVWSVVTGMVFIPVLVVPVGVLGIYVCRKKVTPLLDDELEQRIRGDAALRTLEILFIAGIIIMSIFFSFTMSTSLAPKISSQIFKNEDTTRSMTVTIHYTNPTELMHSSKRSFIIKNMESMNYEEAESYASFWLDELRDYYDTDLTAKIVGIILILILGVFGLFYVYYRHKY